MLSPESLKFVKNLEIDVPSRVHALWQGQRERGD